MILTLKELAEHLKVNERTILRMKDSGQITGSKIGGQWRFNGSEIDKIFFPGKAKDAESDDAVKHMQIAIPVSRTMDADHIILDMKSTTWEGAIEELTAPRLFNAFVLDTRDLTDKCLVREKMCSTGVGNGIAVPHPRDPIATLQRPGCLVYGYSKAGIDFGALDGKPVHHFFLVCSQNIDLHLYLMGTLSRMLSSESFIAACEAAKEPGDILKAVLEEERKSFLR